jgi:hypothetical protein
LLHVSLGRASTVQASLGVDEVQVLARSRRHPIGSSAWAWRSGSTPRSGAATLSGTVVSTSATAFHGALEEDQEHDRNNAHLHLQQIIDATPDRDHLTLLTTRFGKIYADTGFSDQFREWCDQAGLPARCVFHGLPKAACGDPPKPAVRRMRSPPSAPMPLREVERSTKTVDQMRLAKSALAKTAAREPDPT